jgi:hypothetical protein
MTPAEYRLMHTLTLVRVIDRCLEDISPVENSPQIPREEFRQVFGAVTRWHTALYTDLQCEEPPT